MSLANPSTGFSWLNFKVTASGAKLRPLMAAQARIEPAKRAARIGQIIRIESTILAFANFQNVKLSVKAAVSHDIPPLTCVTDHFRKPGASKANIKISARSVTMEVSSWLCGTWPFFLALSSFFGVGCSVLSAAGFSGIIYNLVSRISCCVAVTGNR